MNRLVLIDGNAIVHRAYHALPPLTAPDGSLVNAVYGFTSILLKIFQELRPTHMAVAFDRPAPTFRKKLFAQYQAKRPKMEDELSNQVDMVHDLLGAFGIPTYEVDGFEADDIIGTITKKALSSQLSALSKLDQVIIVTGDRDLLQLVDDTKRVKVFMPVKGLSEGKLFGEKEAKERLGVEPQQIPDFKALAGDASDNYPGVAGIGPKTAAELLEKFGSLEALMMAIKKESKPFKELSEGLQEKLKEGIESAKLSKQLATIRSDAPVDAATIAPLKTLDVPPARKVLESLGFKSLLKRLSGSTQASIGKEPKANKTREKDEQEQLSLV